MKKILFLTLLLTFSLAACQTDAPEEDQDAITEETLDDAIDIIDRLSPVENLDIEEETESERRRAVKEAALALDGLEALDIYIAVTEIDEETYKVTVSKDTLNKSTEITVEQFTLINVDYEAIVQEAFDVIDQDEDFIELEITEDTQEAKNQAIVDYYQSFDGMSERRVDITVTYLEEEWAYSITVSRQDESLSTQKSHFGFKVVKPVVDEFLYEMVNAVRDHFGEDYLPATPIQEQQLKEVHGLDPEWAEDYYAEGPMWTMGVDVMIAVSIKDGHKDDVQAAMEAYKEYLINDSFQYPVNMPKAQATKTHYVGDYAFLILLSTPYEGEDEGEALAHYESVNQEAIDIINAHYEANN